MNFLAFLWTRGSLSYTPSTRVAFKMASALISIARSAAAGSVVKYVLPVPAAKEHTFPLSPRPVGAERVLAPQGPAVRDLLGKGREDPVVDPVRLPPHQGLPRQLQQDASVHRFSHGTSGCGGHFPFLRRENEECSPPPPFDLLGDLPRQVVDPLRQALAPLEPGEPPHADGDALFPGHLAQQLLHPAVGILDES